MSECIMWESFFCITISLAWEQMFFIPFTGTTSALKSSSQEFCRSTLAETSPLLKIAKD